MSPRDIDGPKTFISYSWSSPEHEAWVLQLATELEESGANVILDKWDLREGADKYAFMEKMVTDPDVRKVVVICDHVYAEKADGRQGGVGTETQIISKELYEQVDPTDQCQKFVAVITEKDDKGKPLIPTFLKSRIYIDMSDISLRAQNFEQLLNWIYDKPLHKRPEHGRPPAHIIAERGISLGTSSRFRLAIEAIRLDRASAVGLVLDYFNTFAENLESFRTQPDKTKEFDEQVIENIEAFLPYRDEAIDLIFAIARFRSDFEMYEAMHTFFERLLPYKFSVGERSGQNDPSVDNFKFILNELFLYAVAALLKNNKVDAVNHITSEGYYVELNSPWEGSRKRMIGYVFFRSFLESLNHRNERLYKQRPHNLMAELLRERAKRSDINLEDLMQADLILHLRDELHASQSLNSGWSWFPYTLVFALHRQAPFELFLRAESTRYFDRVKTSLSINSKDELSNLIEDFKIQKSEPARFGQFSRLDYKGLTNLEGLATRP